MSETLLTRKQGKAGCLKAYSQIDKQLSEPHKKIVSSKDFPWELVAPRLARVPEHNQTSFLFSVIHQYCSLPAPTSTTGVNPRAQDLALNIDTHCRFWSVNGTEEGGDVVAAPLPTHCSRIWHTCKFLIKLHLALFAVALAALAAYYHG
ncbi:hypothetical protein BASA81_007749 [Batrachochytrium salamandrivorans]|nr:hypothetical protein BASA81_007749 [Batrachochytrium salamandrivorans]